MGNIELVTGDNDLFVTVTPVRGVFVVALSNQTPVALSDVQLAWFPPVGGEVLTKVAPLTVPPMGEVMILVGYACPNVGPWRLVVVFRSGDGTEESLVCTRTVVAGDSVPGTWQSVEAWRELAPFLKSTEVSLPAGTPPGIALQVIGKEIAVGAISLKDDDLALASIDPIVMVRLALPGKVIISHAPGLVIPDPAFLARKLIEAGVVDHYRAYFELGTGVSQLRLYLDLNWYVDEVVNVINKIHRVLADLHAPAVLDPLIPMLDKRETLKDLTAVERQVFEKTLQKLEQITCPA